ncbi:diguanylate cyclase [Paracoccus caeni]|uniref:diguanylate cyclase n=1 Tax=Paracoccus caeni TaxID=657651 RepID=A0A934SDS8_9RHOB|nr:diguanylate cyclase [Paracoccus caeni]MBK4215514.1 diguanylate cyclase [Paracoccus caeni]
MTARILVADGVATSRIMLKVRLTSACYEVEAVSSCTQLVASVESNRPDLILLGSGLDDRDLVTLCRAIAQEWPQMTVLALADGETRIQALQAGATATLPPSVDEPMLLARIRCLLRDAETGQATGLAMAEMAAPFDNAPGGEVTLVADSPARAMRWRHLLQGRLGCSFAIRNPEEALSAAASGLPSDLYVIAADIGGRGDGLRLLSELRSRSGSRDAAFVVATEPHRDEMAAIALDLGAGEVLPIDLSELGNVEMAALTLRNQLARKRRSDHRRAEAQRTLIWAMTDPLTGLFNRRYALPRIAEIAAEAMRQDHLFAVLALDLDHFKAVNDRHGHAAGDAVLCDIARRLETVVADRGLTARLGGEEFLVILPRTGEHEAYRMAEEIRRAVEMRSTLLPRLSGGGMVSVTLSVGLAVSDPGLHVGSPESLADISLERADRALIAAKTRGRNRVMLAAFQATH